MGIRTWLLATILLLSSTPVLAQQDQGQQQQAGEGSGAEALAATGRPQFDNIISFGIDSEIEFLGDQTSIGFIAGYHRIIVPDYGLAVGYRTSVDILDAASVTTTAWENYFGARYFLRADPNIRDQIFLDAGIGFALFDSTNVDSEIKFIWEFGGGKNFELGPRTSWTPRVALQGGSDLDVTINLQLLALSYFF